MREFVLRVLNYIEYIDIKCKYEKKKFKCSTQQIVTEEYKLNTKTSFNEAYLTM